MSEKKEQVAQQYRAIIHMAEAIAKVHKDLLPLLGASPFEDLLDHQGKWSAARMEVLGDMLNNMEANDPEADKWMDPVFAEAQRLWPTP